MPNEICIDNLPKDIDVPKLCSIFAVHGRILSASIDVDKHFFSLGKGYISFDNPSSVHHAVKSMNGCTAFGNKLKVMKEPSDSSDSIKTIKEIYTKIFVKNIHPDWDECDLWKEFLQFGEIKEAQISVKDGKSNGYGFVIFKNHSSAKAAVESKHKHLVIKPYIPKALRDEKTVSPDSARAVLEKSVQFNNLHIKNIPKDMSESELKRLFEVFGETTSVKIAMDDSQRSKGFGFVCFQSERDAENARKHMDGYSLKSNILVVNFNQKKHVRQQHLALKNLENNSGRSRQEAKATARDAFQPGKNSLFFFSTK